MSDHYLTLATSGEAQYVEKRSRFLAFALHVENEEDIKQALDTYRKKYYDARHVCYAWVLGVEGENFRANDDGEPGGSAGKPIHGAIRSHNLTDVLVVVVRYFGGVKLGTGGLVVAYKTAAAEALDAATVEERVITSNIQVEAPYTAIDGTMRQARNSGAEIKNIDYTDTNVILTIEIRSSEEDNLRTLLSQNHLIHVIPKE